MNISNRVHLQEYVYDAAVDSLVNGTNVVLSDKNGRDPIPVGAIVQSVHAVVLTDVESLGAATVAWGHASTADGYSGTTIAKATLVDGFSVNGWDLDASLLWDGTNDHQLTPVVVSAATGAFVVLIGTADLTAGKIWFGVTYIMPSLV